jgi:prolyl-tRNA editing enzyme YbaK/EbsC (Cys-tRNA(Pro) deacylase)
MILGKLDFASADQHPELLAEPTYQAIKEYGLPDVLVAGSDSKLADTAAFCEAYGIGMDISVNCVIAEAKRADRIWYAACLILATSRVDLNGVVRRHLDASKISFAGMDTATSLTNMEFGGITPIGLPSDWPILVDEAVLQRERVVIGSGIRASKLLVKSSLFTLLPNAVVKDIAKKTSPH